MVKHPALPARQVYEIRVKGHLDGDHWKTWFGGMAVRAAEGGEPVICGPVAD